LRTSVKFSSAVHQTAVKDDQQIRNQQNTLFIGSHHRLSLISLSHALAHLGYQGVSSSRVDLH